MTNPVDIRPDHLRIVHDVLQDHLPAGVKVWVFGSRAQWSARDGSDLDLALEGETEIDRKVIEALTDAFEDSDLPFTVDVVDINRVNERFRQIVKDQWVHLTPGSQWIDCTLADACDAIDYGLTASASDKPDGPRFLRITDIVSGPIDWDSVPYVAAGEATTAKYRLNDGDIVIARTGASTGSSAYIKNPPTAVFASYLVRLVATPEFDSRFLAYYLQSPNFKAYINGVLGDKSAQPNASASTMTKAPLYAPRSKGEQRAIANVLGALDDKIDLNRRMNGTLEEMARALFKSWFVDFDPVQAKMNGRWQRGESLPGLPAESYNLFPENLAGSELGNIPEGWAIGTLGDIAVSPNRTVSPAEVPPETPYIGLQHMPRRSLALDRWEGAGQVTSNKSVFRQGALLFGKLRPYFHKVGIASVAGIASTDIVVVEPIAPVWSGLAACHLSSDEFVAYADRTSTGTRMPRTSWPVMKRYAICLPSEPVAREFQKIVGPLLDRIVQNCNTSHALHALQNVLLPKLISGEIQAHRVRDEM